MYIANRKETKKYCCYMGSKIANSIPEEDRLYINKETAVRSGYTLHPECNIITKSLEKEAAKINEIAKKNGLRITETFDSLHIKSPLGEWKIIVAGREHHFYLYHKNGPKAADLPGAKVPGYHWHNKRFDQLSGYIAEIARHDNWRMSAVLGDPNGEFDGEGKIIHDFNEIGNTHKYGSKAYKKHERAEKRRKAGYDIKRTLCILDALAEQRRRSTLLNGVGA